MSESNLYPFQLLDVRLYEAVIERLESEGEVETDAEAEREMQVPLAIGLSFTEHSERHISAFLNLDIKSPAEQAITLHLCFTLEGLFTTIVDLEDIEPDLRQEFESISATTLLWPYARECVHHFAQRMRVEFPLLPTLNRLSLVPEDTEEADVKVSPEDITDSG